jgi:hypothetical protein
MGILALVLSSAKVAMVGIEMVLREQVDTCDLVETGIHFMSWLRRQPWQGGRKGTRVQGRH